MTGEVYMSVVAKKNTTAALLTHMCIQIMSHCLDECRTFRPRTFRTRTLATDVSARPFLRVDVSAKYIFGSGFQ